MKIILWNKSLEIGLCNKAATSVLLSSFFLASAANADVGFGVGVSLVYGGETGFDVGIGPKLFTTNEEKKAAASAGVDYLIMSSSFRPNVGVSYLFKEDAYADINVGYNLKSQSIDFGLGGGYTKTEKKEQPSVIINQNTSGGAGDGAGDGSGAGLEP